jgi:lysozyme
MISCMMALSLIAPLEGFRAEAYPDAHGWSIGYGTFGARQGDTVTEEQAVELACEDIDEASDLLAQTVAPLWLSRTEMISYVSLIYNIGSGGWLKSAVLRKLRLGDREGAIRSLNSWVRSGGEVLPVLIARRRVEARYGTGCYAAVGRCRSTMYNIASIGSSYVK